jgi:iron(III) transport system substrate-binding protein
MTIDGTESLNRARLTRRALLRGTLAAAVGPALLACQSAPETRAPAAPAPSPASPAQAPAAPAAGTAAAPEEWQQQWDALVAAARQEGTLVLSGPPTPAVRTEVPAAFKRRFGIDVEYLAVRSGEVMARLEAERAAGQYTVDVMLTGASTLYNVGYPRKMFAPLPPALILPEATDPTKWQAGRVWYGDPEQQYILRLSNQMTFIVAVNTDYVRPEELGSWHDLLDPKYRGKISSDDPTVAGAGSNRVMYLIRSLGEDYVRALFRDQQVAISREERQLSDWLARGQHPISLSAGTNDVVNLRQEGFPIAVVLTNRPEAPGMVTAGFGMIALLEPAPHPNAARLFVNWIAGPEGNEVYNRAQVNASVRTDLDNSWMPDFAVPRPGVPYLDGYSWEWVTTTHGPEEFEAIRRLVGRAGS